MMLALEFADFGFGTVVGAIVAGSIAIFLDQRRRTDERRSRFIEERRLMYKNIVQTFEMFGEQMLLFAKFQPYFRRTEELDPEAQQLVQQAFEGLQNSLAKINQRFIDYGVDLSLLGSRAAALAASALLETLDKMLDCIAADERRDLSWMQVIFEGELQNFRHFARQDLGITD